MLSLELRRIIPKAAGTYFIVRDNSQVTELENENKMRLFFLNVEQGPVNMAVYFAKGDITGFQSTFGKSTRSMLKKGNFSIDTCIDALSAGPICCINLRSFDDTLDKVNVLGMNMNSTKIIKQITDTPYRSVFKTNTFWTPDYNRMNTVMPNTLLNFSNVGNGDISVFVTRSRNVKSITSEGNKTLAASVLEIDEYPALDFETLVRDTCVDVYLFANTFTLANGVTTNRYYGHLFDNQGNININKIQELASIPEAGFVSMYTGSVIPDLISETGAEISINNVINQHYMETGLICDINEDVLEIEYDKQHPENYVINSTGFSLFDNTGQKKSSVTATEILGHVLPTSLTKQSVTQYPPTTTEQNVAPAAGQIYTYKVDKVVDNPKAFETSFEQGIRIGDYILGETGIVQITAIETVGEDVGKTGSFTGFTKIRCICSDKVKFDSTNITKFADFMMTSQIKPFSLVGCKPRKEQFLDGTAKRQNDILNMMVDPGIVKGIVSAPGIRYIIDTFKSFVEAGYKSQYGNLVAALDERNCFVRSILNEPFVDDLIDSTNPLFKQTPTGSFDSSFLETGGNKNFSSKVLSKFVNGSDKCYFYGPGERKKNVLVGLAGKISNLFYTKQNGFDVVANRTGNLSGVSELEYRFDDDDRMYCEHFQWNPIIQTGSRITIFGNNTAQQARTAQQQIHNSELLCDIKQNLYNLAKKEAFTKGNYDDYLRTESEAKAYMDALVLAGAIEPKPVVICNSTNNTREIRKQRVKLVHIEYTPIDAIEKVVFDLSIN